MRIDGCSLLSHGQAVGCWIARSPQRIAAIGVRLSRAIGMHKAAARAHSARAESTGALVRGTARGAVREAAHTLPRIANLPRQAHRSARAAVAGIALQVRAGAIAGG